MQDGAGARRADPGQSGLSGCGRLDGRFLDLERVHDALGG
jgi:hypothetical protein